MVLGRQPNPSGYEKALLLSGPYRAGRTVEAVFPRCVRSLGQLRPFESGTMTLRKAIYIS